MKTLRPLQWAAKTAWLVASVGCSSIPPAGGPGNELVSPAGTDDIRWPERYVPDEATFFVHNEVDISAPPQVVWDVLVEASTWADWYEGARNVQLAAEDATSLDAGAVFDWETMGFSFRSTVVEFQPPMRLGWESRKSTLKGYHAWLLVPVEGGTRLVTDESQFGLLAVLQRWFQPNKLRRLHDVWLAAIKERAEQRALRPTSGISSTCGAGDVQNEASSSVTVVPAPSQTLGVASTKTACR